MRRKKQIRKESGKQKRNKKKRFRVEEEKKLGKIEKTDS